MSEQKGYSVDPLTRLDLDSALEKQRLQIKEIFDLKLDPVKETVDGHSRTLYGQSGGNGLTGTVKVLKWSSGVLFTVVIGIVIKNYLF